MHSITLESPNPYVQTDGGNRLMVMCEEKRINIMQTLLELGDQHFLLMHYHY